MNINVLKSVGIEKSGWALHDDIIVHRIRTEFLLKSLKIATTTLWLDFAGKVGFITIINIHHDGFGYITGMRDWLIPPVPFWALIGPLAGVKFSSIFRVVIIV